MKSVIASILLFVIIIASIIPVFKNAPGLIIWPIGYGCYCIIKEGFGVLPPTRQRGRFNPIRLLAYFGRWIEYRKSEGSIRFFFILITLMALAVIFSLQLHHAYWIYHQTTNLDISWLLIFFPITRLAYYGSTKRIFLLMGIAIFAIFLTSVLNDEQSSIGELLRILVIRVGILIVLCLLPAKMSSVHYSAAIEHSNESDFVTAMTEVEQIETNIEPAIPEQVVEGITGVIFSPGHHFFHQAAEVIAEKLGFTEVFIFIDLRGKYQPGDVLRAVGASSKRGKTLVEQPFCVDKKGVIAQTAMTTRSVVINDTQNLKSTDDYVWNALFTDIRSEVAIPIMLGHTILGVLDMQSIEPNTFGPEELRSIQHIANHLAVAMEHHKSVKRLDALYQVSNEITKRFLSRQEMKQLLIEIVDAALKTLHAKSVVLYPYLYGQFSDPVYRGVMTTKPASAERINNPAGEHSAAHKIMFAGKPEFISHGAQSHELLNSPRVGDELQQPFAIRENLQATAVLPLYMKTDAVPSETDEAYLGVIFINFTHPQEFQKEFQLWCSTLSTLATLALQNARLHEKAREKERMKIWNEVHDRLGQYTAIVLKYLTRIEASAQEHQGYLTTHDIAALSLALESSTLLQRQVRYLTNIWRKSPAVNNWQRHGDGSGFFDGVREFLNIFGSAFEVECKSRFTGSEQDIPYDIQVFIDNMVREIVYNAARHGDAHHISMRLNVALSHPGVSLQILDDGCGFGSLTKEAILHRQGGLASFHKKLAEEGGTLEFSRHLQRTIVACFIPLSPEAVRCIVEDPTTNQGGSQC